MPTRSFSKVDNILKTLHAYFDRQKLTFNIKSGASQLKRPFWGARENEVLKKIIYVFKMAQFFYENMKARVN